MGLCAFSLCNIPQDSNKISSPDNTLSQMLPEANFGLLGAALCAFFAFFLLSQNGKELQ